MHVLDHQYDLSVKGQDQYSSNALHVNENSINY